MPATRSQSANMDAQLQVLMQIMQGMTARREKMQNEMTEQIKTRQQEMKGQMK